MTWRTHTDSPLRHSASGRARRQRHHGSRQPFDRWELERAGWRTTLEFRENHARLDDGQLIDVEPFWVAEAERDGIVICATARSESRAWSRLERVAHAAAQDFFGAEVIIATP